MGSAIASDHILLVNFPSASRVKSLIRELQTDPDHPGCEVVIVTDRIETLPFDIANVLFIKGSPLEEETFHQAGISSARLAIVLATAADDSASDAVVSSVVSVIEKLRPELRTVAECLDRGRYQELRLRPGGVPQAILRSLTERTAVELFEVAKPSLHEIFVRIAGPGVEKAGQGIPQPAERHTP